MLNIDEKPLIVNTINDIRERLFSSNFQPVPVQTGCKKSYQKGWHTTIGISGSATVDALNTGILCTGLRAIDIDCDDPKDAEKIYALAVKRWPDAPVRSRLNTPRKLLMLRAAEGTPGKRVIQGAGHTQEHSRAVEILGNRNFFVAFGTHPSGADYEWNLVPGIDLERDDLPEVSETEISEFLAECSAVIEAPEERHRAAAGGSGEEPNQDTLLAPGGVEDVIRLLNMMPNTVAVHGNRNAWVGCIAAAIGAAGDKNRAIVEPAIYEWCERYTGDIEDDAAEKAIASINSPYRCGWRKLLNRAEGEGVDVSQWRIEEAKEAFTAEPLPTDAPAPPTAARGKRFSINRIMPLDHSIRTPELIENWFGAGEFLRLNGAPGSGKTTLAVDQGVHIAAGIPWRGNKVTQGAVLFVELEGAAGLQTRIEATCTELGLRQNELPLFMITENLSLAVKADADELLAEIMAALPAMGGTLRLIVIDTQARATAGADENSASDAAVVIRAIDNIRAASGAAVMLLHHLPHGGERGRGSGAYLGAVDCEMLGTRDESGLGTVKCVKMRNRQEPKPFYYRLKSQPIGCGPDGGLVTGACAVAAVAPAKGSVNALKGNAAKAMETLIALTAGGAVVTRAAWAAAFEVAYDGKGSDRSVADIFNRKVADLVAAGRVTIDGAFVSVAGRGQSHESAWAELLDGPLQ